MATMPEGPIPFPRDVAFEVSPSDKGSDVQSEQREYAANGVIQVWVDPQERTIEVTSPKHPAFRAQTQAIERDVAG